MRSILTRARDPSLRSTVFYRPFLTSFTALLCELCFENEDIPLSVERLMMRWDDVDANEDDATEEEELARPNSPSFNARTRFDDDARRIISYLFSLSSQMCVRAWCIHASWGNGMKVTSPSRCEIRLKLGLKVYQKRSKKSTFSCCVRQKRKNLRLRSEPRLLF